MCTFSGKPEQGIQAAERVVEIDPTYANAYNILASLYTMNNEYLKAISTIKKYMALQPDNRNTYDSACEVYIHVGQLDEALNICEEALKINPNWFWFYVRMGCTHILKGEGDKAREKFQKYSILYPPGKARMTIYSGHSYLFEGRYNGALIEFKKAVELNRNSLRARFDSGKILAIQGNYSAAL